jgi:aminoglycoside phosphotransferase (APT) family kinase protein
MIAFTLMSATSRAAFREALGVDDATWMRGRGWAPATGLNAYTTYAAVDPRVAAQTSRQIPHSVDQGWAGIVVLWDHAGFVVGARGVTRRDCPPGR